VQTLVDPKNGNAILGIPVDRRLRWIIRDKRAPRLDECFGQLNRKVNFGDGTPSRAIQQRIPSKLVQSPTQRYNEGYVASVESCTI